MKLLITFLSVCMMMAACTTTNKDESDGFSPCLPPPLIKLDFQFLDGNNRDLMDSTATDYLGNIRIVNTCNQAEINTSILHESNGFILRADDIYYSAPVLHFNCRKYLLVYDSGIIDTLEFEIENLHPENQCSPFTVRNLRINGNTAQLVKEDWRVFFIIRK